MRISSRGILSRSVEASWRVDLQVIWAVNTYSITPKPRSTNEKSKTSPSFIHQGNPGVWFRVFTWWSGRSCNWSSVSRRSSSGDKLCDWIYRWGFSGDIGHTTVGQMTESNGRNLVVIGTTTRNANPIEQALHEKRCFWKNSKNTVIYLVPEVGLEPTQPCGHRILNPARLPIPPLRPESGFSISRHFLTTKGTSAKDKDRFVAIFLQP